MRPYIAKVHQQAEKYSKSGLIKILDSVLKEYTLYDSVFDSLVDGMVVLNFTHQIQMINKAAKRFLQISGRSLYEKKVWQLIKDTVLADFIKTALLAQDKVSGKDFCLSSSGCRVILSISIMPLVFEKNILGSIIHLQEVTEQREQSVRLSRAERLAALTTLTASVAHEIKNPLAAMSIHMQLLEKALNQDKLTPEFLRKTLNVVTEEIDRLNRTIVDFLFSVRPMDMKQQFCDLSILLKDLNALIGAELKEKGIQFDYLTAPDLPKVFIDEKLIKQALLNIINNSISAMNQAKTPHLILSTKQELNWVVISIKDNGCGIKESLLNKIFEPYYSTKENGSGLGLTVVYKIIQEHKGELQLDSKEGKGSIFYIKLPILSKERNLLKGNECIEGEKLR